MNLFQLLRSLRTKSKEREFEFVLEQVELCCDIFFFYSVSLELAKTIHEISAFRQMLYSRFAISSMEDVGHLTLSELRELRNFVTTYEPKELFQ